MEAQKATEAARAKEDIRAASKWNSVNAFPIILPFL